MSRIRLHLRLHTPPTSPQEGTDHRRRPDRRPTARQRCTHPARLLESLSLRAATVLGLVGAGGLGTELVLAFRLFRYHELLTLVFAILVLVAAIDFTGQLVR